MKISDMIHYTDKALQLFPTINCFVLTGGEVSCFSKSDICKVIAYAKSVGIVNIRIVSNGVWAKIVESAYAYLSELKNFGLTEVNISTGDEHSLFVPLPNVNQIIDNTISEALVDESADKVALVQNIAKSAYHEYY